MKRFLITALLVALVGAVAAYFIWNKPHAKAEDETGISVTSQALYAAYKSDEQAANTLYLNKVLVVTGPVLSREKNQDGQLVAVLQGDAGDDLLAGGVMCTMRDSSSSIPSGNNITLKGFCTGFVNDVHLTNCIVQDK